jgi:CcmD family protein
MNAILLTLSALDSTPDTSGYMIAGYAVIFGVMLVYLVSLAVRSHNLKQELRALEDLEHKAKKTD